MPDKKSKPQTKAKAKAKISKPSSKSRKLARPTYKSFRLSKRIQHPGPKLTGAFRLLRAASQHVWAHKKLFAGIALVYFLLTLLLVRGLVLGTDLVSFKELVEQQVAGTPGKLASSLTVFGLLIGSSGAGSEVASLYQSTIVALISLAFIWALRRTHAGEPATLKNSFYQSTYPLVPFLLVIVILCIQLLPVLVASFLYGATVVSGIAVTALEIVLWSTLCSLLVLWSLYMLTASVFALYIVTLPDTTPIKAVRSARQLVEHRRWTVMRKFLFLPAALFVIGLLIMLPIILWATSIAEITFLVLSACGLVVAHSYMYALYRELLA
jgi:hypothetical protein